MNQKLLIQAFEILTTAKSMTEIYEKNFRWLAGFVHATSRGHEAIQIATGLLLHSEDFLSAYYRDDAMLLSTGIQPIELMLQLMAKKDDPFSGGRTYYCHPSMNRKNRVKLIHSSSATGMQAIPSVGLALGLQYREKRGLLSKKQKKSLPIVVCSIGDAAMTEGEVAEALQMAALKQLAIIFLVQDNGWDISAKAEETRAMNAFQYTMGFPGIEAHSLDGSDFVASYKMMNKVINKVRKERRPFLIHADVPLLNHHTSGVRMDWYRDDLDEHRKRDPYGSLKSILIQSGMTKKKISKIEKRSLKKVSQAFESARKSAEPLPSQLFEHDFAPTPIVKEKGVRKPVEGEEKVMVDCALWAINEIMMDHPECLFYGQDVGRRLGGVFREAALLANKYGDDRVFNTAIQEAFIVGSTVGMSAIGLKPIVEVQFADYIWPGLNQLFSEVSRSCYLSNGQWPVSMILRVPVGAYRGGGPFHSSSIETIVTNIRGIKVVYPSNGADLKGLMKAAYYDPNPVLILEHKGLYWSKVPGTESAKVVMPDKDYILPLGLGNMVLEANEDDAESRAKILIICYGMGVHWSLTVAKEFPEQIGILDLRSLYPLDEDLIFSKAMEYHRILVLTEEPVNNSFAQSIAARIQERCFEFLEAPVVTIGSENVPAIPMNLILEDAYLPSIEKIKMKIIELLSY